MPITPKPHPPPIMIHTNHPKAGHLQHMAKPQPEPKTLAIDYMLSTMAHLSLYSPLYSYSEAGEAQILSLLQPAATVTVSQCHKYWQSPDTLNGISI